MAADALSALLAATRACAATAGRFSPEQSSEAIAYADELRDLFTQSTVAAATTAKGNRDAPLLPQLPTELIPQVLRHLDVRGHGRLACTCRQLYFGPPCPPRPTSVVEEELRGRAAEAGRRLPSSPPAGASGWVLFLLQREWRDCLAMSTVAAAGAPHSLFIDANRALLTCGFEDMPGALGLPRDQGAGDGARTVLAPTLVPSMAGSPIRHVVAGYDTSLAVSEAGRVYMWGPALSGRLESDAEDRVVPTLIEELCDHRVRQVAAGYHHCAAVTEEGALFMWWNARGEDEWMEMEEEEEPQLGLLHGAPIGNLWPPQCVTALGKEAWSRWRSGGTLLWWRRRQGPSIPSGLAATGASVTATEGPRPPEAHRGVGWRSRGHSCRKGPGPLHGADSLWSSVLVEPLRACALPPGHPKAD
jgi:hypothetical protein